MNIMDDFIDVDTFLEERNQAIKKQIQPIEDLGANFHNQRSASKIEQWTFESENYHLPLPEPYIISKEVTNYHWIRPRNPLDEPTDIKVLLQLIITGDDNLMYIPYYNNVYRLISWLAPFKWDKAPNWFRKNKLLSNYYLTEISMKTNIPYMDILFNVLELQNKE